VTNPSTTGEDFIINGQSLMTYAYAIQTLAGRENIPPRVGDNIRIPYRNGRIWKPKTYDQRVITLGMWVKDTDVNGVTPVQGPRAQFNTNLRALKRLFAPLGAQLSMQRTLIFASGMETHTAQGECSGTMDLTPITIRVGTLTIDITMADPWWYGSPASPTVSSTGAAITNIGDVEAQKIVLTFNGPLTNPRLTNTSVLAPVSVWYNGTIAGGASVTLDCGVFTAVNNLGASVIGSVSHQGSLRWMLLEPGSNAMTLDNVAGGSVGAGSVTVAYSPPYT
jgi:hypothetical protein